MGCSVYGFDEVLTAYSKWDVGASGAHTKTSNYPGTLFSSVAKTATGKYTVTFARGVPSGPFLGLYPFYEMAADSETLCPRATVSSYTAETAAAAATAKFEVWEIDETAAQVEPASGSKLLLRAEWLKTK